MCQTPLFKGSLFIFLKLVSQLIVMEAAAKRLLSTKKKSFDLQLSRTPVPLLRWMQQHRDRNGLAPAPHHHPIPVPRSVPFRFGAPRLYLVSVPAATTYFPHRPNDIPLRIVTYRFVSPPIPSRSIAPAVATHGAPQRAALRRRQGGRSRRRVPDAAEEAGWGGGRPRRGGAGAGGVPARAQEEAEAGCSGGRRAADDGGVVHRGRPGGLLRRAQRLTR